MKKYIVFAMCIGLIFAAKTAGAKDFDDSVNDTALVGTATGSGTASITFDTPVREFFIEVQSDSVYFKADRAGNINKIDTSDFIIDQADDPFHMFGFTTGKMIFKAVTDTTTVHVRGYRNK